MAAQAIGSLFVSLGLDSAAFTAGVKQAQGRAAQFAANLNKRLGALGNVPGINKLQAGLSAMSAGVAAAAGAASAAAVAALGAMSVSAINTAAEIQNLSRIANAAPEEFQKMAYAADQVGISQEKLSDILKDVNDRVGDFVATGGGPMADFFERIAPQVGVTADQFRNLSGPKALQLYVSSLEKANVNQQDFTFFMEAMASDSTALLPILRNGGKLAQEYGNRLVALGGVMSNDTVAKLASMKTAMREVGVVLVGIKNALGAAFAPVIEALARAFVSLFEAGAPLRQMFDGIVKVVSGVAEVLGAIITIISAVVNGIWDVVSAGAAWVNSATGIGSALKTLWDSTIGGIARVLIWIANLIKATGGIGGAFRALKDVAVEVFHRIGLAFDVVPAAVAAGAQAMKSIFLGAIHDMLANFAWFISSVARGMNSVFGTALSEAEPFQETVSSLSSAASDAADASAAAAERMSASWAAASAPLQSLRTLNDSVAQGAAAAAASLGGGGLSQSLDDAGKSASGAKDKLTPLQEVMKRLRDEFEKLSATAGMTDLQAKIWGDQRESGVNAASDAGKSIAALNEQIDTLQRTKDAVQRGKDAFRDFFGGILEGVDGAKQALLSLLAEMAKVQFAKGMLGLLGSTSWGSSFVKSVGSLVGANANGTSHWQGGLTRIHERGEEIVQLPSGSKVFPAGLSRRMADDHQTGGVIRVEIDKSEYFDAKVTEIAAGEAAQMGKAVSASIPARIQQYQAKPRTR